MHTNENVRDERALKLIAMEYEAYPNRTPLAFATSESIRKLGAAKSAIGGWDQKKNRYVLVAVYMEDDNWNGVPLWLIPSLCTPDPRWTGKGFWHAFSHEFLINGKPLPIEWVPVPRESVNLNLTATSSTDSGQ